MNDIMVFSTKKKEWSQEIYYPVDYGGGVVINPPKRRMHMAADFYGCIMVVHGGFSAEDKDVLGDFNAYDFKRRVWCRIVPSKASKKIAPRFSHTLTSMLLNSVNDPAIKFTRSIWGAPPQLKDANDFEPLR